MSFRATCWNTLIDNYCKEESFHEDMSDVVTRFKENFVHGAEAEKIRHFIRERRHHTIIANLEARLVETEDKYWATISAINEQFVNIPEQIIRQYPMLLSGGMWGTIDLTYDETEIHNKKIRPFKIMAFTPVPESVLSTLTNSSQNAKQFTSDEWIDILVNSQGLNPAILTRRQKLLYICRSFPLIESNVNMIELGPRETGKTYLVPEYFLLRPSSCQEAKPHQPNSLSTSIPARLVWSGQGMRWFSMRSLIPIFRIPNHLFRSCKAICRMQSSAGERKRFSHLQVLYLSAILMCREISPTKNIIIFLNRSLISFRLLHLLTGFMPIFPVGRSQNSLPSSYSKDYGFITDYLCEIMHELRKTDGLDKIRQRFEVFDVAKTERGISGRDQRGVIKVLSGLMKIIYPDGNVTDPN